MNKSECVYKEYERLKSLFLDGDEAKLSLVDELIKRASFLSVELKSLERDFKKVGVLQYSSKGNVRTNPSFKTYLQTLIVYQGIIKTLNSVLDTNVSEDDDEFTQFLAKVETR